MGTKGGYPDNLIIAGRTIRSRLFLGTGKFASGTAMAGAVKASGAEIVTVALRRVDLENPEDDILSRLDARSLLILPNTSGARDASEAVRLARGAAGEHYLKGWEEKDAKGAPLVEGIIDLPDRLPGPGTDNLAAPGGFEPAFKLPGASQ